MPNQVNILFFGLLYFLTFNYLLFSWNVQELERRDRRRRHV